MNSEWISFGFKTSYYKEFYNRTILSFINFKGYRQHSCFRQLYKTNYLIEWLAVSHGCLWQIYQLREKKSCRYCCHLWSMPRTFQTTHVDIHNQLLDRMTWNFTWMLMTDVPTWGKNLAVIVAIYGRGREHFRPPTQISITTNYLIEWLAISHGCLWQMYQLRKKNIADIVAICGRGRELFRPPT